jgi:hypothetical protein
MNKPENTKKPGRKKLTDKQPATKGYAPIDHRWYERPRDLPPFTFRTIRDMLLEPTIRLGLKMRSAPLCSAEFAYKKPGSDEYTPGIQADDPLVAAFVERQLKRIWNDITHLLDAQVWGWSAAEVMYRQVGALSGENDLNRCFIEIDRLLPRHANDTRALVSDGEVKAVRFMRIKEATNGCVDVPFPKAVFHNHSPEPGQHYGTSVLTGAHSPWADKWLNGGALDVRRLFMVKDSYRGAKLFYPNEMYEIPGKGTVPARDIAREIVEQAKAGAIVTLPSDVYADGSPKWRWEESVSTGNPQHILQYPKDLDTEMLRGMEVPDDIFTAEADSSGSWGGKKVPLASFYGGLDVWMTKLLRDLKEQVLDWLVMINFGPGHWYEIKHKPLADQAMENQAKSGPGGGENPFQPRPQPGGFGRDGDGDGQHGESGNGFPKRMGLDPAAAVGEGVLDAAELVKAAGRVIRMRTGEDGGGDGPAKSGGQRWITIGGRKRGDKEHAGGFPVLIDGEGRILGGGPKGLRGQHVSKVGEYFDGERKQREKSKEDKFSDVSGFFDQLASTAKGEQKERDEEHARSAPGNTRSWKKIVAHQAANWDMSPEAYESIADDVWKSSLAMHEDRESAKKYAREQLKLTAADVSRLENQGKDYGSEHKRIKGLDTIGRELAALYPGLGWGEGYGDSERDDYDELAWELVKEGRQAAPSRTSREFHDAIDSYLEGEMRRFGDSWKRPEEVSESAWHAFSLWRMGQRSLWDEDEHPRDDDGTFVEKGTAGAAGKPGADAPKHTQQALFPKAGKPGQGNLFPEKGVPDDMVLKVGRDATEPAKPKLVKSSSIDSPAQGALNQAKAAKFMAWKKVQELRRQIREKPLSRGGLTIPLMRAEESHRAAMKLEKEAKAAIEKRANELGQTTKAARGK